MRRPPDPVTDHAVLRYLERVYGVDVARLKVRLAKITQEGRDRQAAAITSDGVKYILSKSGRVKTCLLYTSDAADE